MDKINEIKNANKNLCEDILKRIDKIDDKDYEDIESIISKDNTEPIYILTYLTIIKKLKVKDFKNEIEKYKFFLSEEIIKNNFPEFNGEKKSSGNLFKELFSKIMNFNDLFESKTLKQKIHFYNNLVFFGLNCEKIKGFIVYKNNKELAIYYLVNKIKEGIIKYINKIKNYEINEEDILIKIQQSIINKEKTDETAIKLANDRILFISKIGSSDFAKYLTNYRIFLVNIKSDFEIKLMI